MNYLDSTLARGHYNVYLDRVKYWHTSFQHFTPVTNRGNFPTFVYQANCRASLEANTIVSPWSSLKRCFDCWLQFSHDNFVWYCFDSLTCGSAQFFLDVVVPLYLFDHIRAFYSEESTLRDLVHHWKPCYKCGQTAWYVKILKKIYRCMTVYEPQTHFTTPSAFSPDLLKFF